MRRKKGKSLCIFGAKGGVGKTSTTIAAVMNPIDVIPNPTPPIITTPDSNDEFWQYGVGMIAGLAAVAIITKIIERRAG